MFELCIARMHDYDTIVYGPDAAARNRDRAASLRGDAKLIDRMMLERVFDAWEVVDALDEAELCRVCEVFGVLDRVRLPGGKAEMVEAVVQEMASRTRSPESPRPPPPTRDAVQGHGGSTGGDPGPFEA